MDADADGAGDFDEPTDAAEDVDDDATKDTTGGSSWSAPESLIYCSAPNSEGEITAVGLAGVASEANIVAVSDEGGVVAQIVPGEDGSFAYRFSASSGQELTFTFEGELTSDEDTDTSPVSITVPEPQDEATELSLMGSGGLSDPDAEGLVAVHAKGELLESGYRAIVANVDLSLGRDALVSCITECRFDLFIPGNTDEEIDVFLVPPGSQAAETSAVTLFIP